MIKQPSDSAWEYEFNEEALKVEEFLNITENADFRKSRLRTALEQNILSWNKYKAWFSDQYDHAILNDNLGPSDLVNLNQNYIKNLNQTNHGLQLTPDQIILGSWDHKIIILGLSCSDLIEQIPHVIFILCSPKIMSQIADSSCSLQDIHATWAHLEENHFDYSTQVRKKFDAFVVLKIKNNETELFKLDEELISEKLDPKLFKYSLNQNSPFSMALQKDCTQVFNLADIQMKILDFKTGSITLLKKGQHVVGFLLGLKTTEINVDDNLALELISEKIA